MSVVSLDHNFVLIRVPKTGSQSQVQLFTKYGKEIIGPPNSINHPLHITSTELKDVFLEKNWDWNNCFKFGFVRNPWEREVSFYFYFKKRKQIENISFSEYIEYQGSVPSGGYEMNNYLTDVDYVARFENFEEETNFIWKKLNLPESPKLLHLNSTEHRPYWEYYNDKEILIVQEKYKKDIELYNYEFKDYYG